MNEELYVYPFMKVIRVNDMEKRLYCFNCNKDVEPLCNLQNNSYIVHKQKIQIKEKVFICPLCNSELFDENLDNSLYDIYNEYLKLYDLSFSKLKKIRESYNLSQELFAKSLGWSKRTIVRYENADSLPQKQYLQIYNKIKNNKSEFINILKTNRKSLGEKLYFKIFNIVNTELDIKTINVFLYVLENNYLTKTQIMKNLFSIDFQSFKEYSKSITSFKYAHGTYGPIFDNKDAILNLLVKQNYLEMVNDEEDKILFKPTTKPDLVLFNKQELDIMNKVLSKLRGKNAKKLTDWSHKFKGWIETKNGELIDYSYAKDFDLSKNW